jgi:cyclophilin family peptidyl-prolyl cis-trans isomerase
MRGSVAMARHDDPNSATAEFFIDIAPLPSLDHTPDANGYTVFGTVVSGIDVVDKIAAVPLGGKGPFEGAAPLTPITIRKVDIVAQPSAPVPQ